MVEVIIKDMDVGPDDVGHAKITVTPDRLTLKIPKEYSHYWQMRVAALGLRIGLEYTGLYALRGIVIVNDLGKFAVAMKDNSKAIVKTFTEE